MEFLPGNFMWDNNSHEKYTNDISSPQAISKLANVMEDDDTGSITDIKITWQKFHIKILKWEDYINYR
jgi:hypothetical protein